jgi:beta-lactamase class D
MKVLFLLLLVLPFGFSYSQDFKKYFEESGVKGSFILYDLSKDKYTYFDSARCCKQFIPASTFKIPNSIIGLETGVIKDEKFVIPWDGITREIEFWNHDMNMAEAIKVSCVPYYQELARRVGEEKMREMVKLLGYGNMDIAGGIDMFWLTGNLRISQAEQVDFLVKLYRDELPVAKRSMDITKKILLLEENNEYKLRAKTGWGEQDSLNIGWFTGWVEKAGNVYFFALNIEAAAPPDSFGKARKEITFKILKEQGII